MENKTDFEIAKSFYGDWFDCIKDLVDENGWLRICNKTNTTFMKHATTIRSHFESRVEVTTESFKTFIRPTCNL